MRALFLIGAAVGLLALRAPELPAPRRSFSPAAGTGQLAAFSPNGSLVAVAGGAASVALFQTGTGLLLRTYSGHAQLVTDLAFAPHPDTVLSADAAGQVRLWHSETLAPLGRWQAPAPLVAVAFAPGGGRAVLATARGCWLWTLRGTQAPVLLRLALPAKSSITALAFAPDGQGLALGFSSGVVVLHQFASNTLKTKVLGTTAVRSLCLQADTLLAAVGTPAVKIWPFGSDASVTALPVPQKLTAVAIESSGRTLALGFETGETMLWSRRENRAEYVCRAKGSTRRLQFQPGGDLLLATYEGDTPKTWLVL